MNMTVKYILVFIAVVLVICLAFGSVTNYVVRSSVGVVDFYDYPNAEYAGKTMLRYFTSAANFFKSFSSSTFSKANPRLSRYYEILDDYKPGLFSFIEYPKYQAVDYIKNDVAQYNFISNETYSYMKLGLGSGEMIKFKNIFDECFISHPHYYTSTSTATFDVDKKFVREVKNRTGYVYYNEIYDGTFIYIPYALCFAFTDEAAASLHKQFHGLYIPLESYCVVECSLYSVDGLLDIRTLYAYADKHWNDSASMNNLRKFLDICFENNYDFDYTFMIPDDYASVAWANGVFHYDSSTKVATAISTVNFDYDNVGDTQ